ncbi:MAG: DNA primase [Actinophytocola sp.]|nr:DNA primase [Actinophytocola sp.]
MDPRTAQMLTAALASAARGWPVFPLRPGTKRPALHGVDACPRTGSCTDGHLGWEQRATTDRDRIRTAWSHAPYNIGIATGPAGLVVIDLDTAKPGEPPPEGWSLRGVDSGADVFAVVAEWVGEPVPADTLTVETPSGGRHLYFTAPAAIALRKTEGGRGNGLGWKIDTRAWGGYVVGPGSVTANGRYRYANTHDLAPLPGWLVDRLRPPAPLPARPVAPIQPEAGRRSRYLEAAVRAELDRVHTAPNGQRNASLYVAALALGQLVAGGALPEAEVCDRLLTAAGRHIACGAYNQRQASQTIRSGLRAGAKRPRRMAA